MSAMKDETYGPCRRRGRKVSSFSCTPPKSPGMPTLHYLTTRPQLIASVCVRVYMCVCVGSCVCARVTGHRWLGKMND